MVVPSRMPHKDAPLRVLLHYDHTELFEDVVRSRFPDVEVRCCTSYADLAPTLEAFAPEVLFCIKFESLAYPRDALMSCRTLRWVANGGAGVDHLIPWDRKRLTVTNASGVASDMMAEYVLGGMLALAIGLPRFVRAMGERRWQFRQVSGISGKRLAIVGLGRTGRAVARLARRLSMQVVGTRARPVATAHVQRVFPADQLRLALDGAHFVVVCAPLTDVTRHLLDEGAFEAMMPGACLVDVSRGGVVDQSALAEALASGHLGGAVVDVFEREPLPASSPLWNMPNVVVTPHCSSVYAGWERRAAEMFCDNLLRWRAGRRLRNVVDPVRGY